MIDAAEKEITKKVHENNWLKSRLKAVEWEALSKGREATLLEERVRELSEQLSESQQALASATVPRADAAAAAEVAAELAASHLPPGPANETEVLRTRVTRLQRELEIKSQYLEDKEAYWAGEMQLLEQRLSDRDGQLATTRGQLGSATEASGEQQVASFSKQAQWAKEKLELTNAASKLRAEIAELAVQLAQATSRAAEGEAKAAAADALEAEVAELKKVAAASKEQAASAGARVGVFEKELTPLIEDAGLSKGGGAPEAVALCASVRIIVDDLRAQVTAATAEPREPPAELVAKLEEAELRSVRAAADAAAAEKQALEATDAAARAEKLKVEADEAAKAASATAEEARAAVSANADKLRTLEHDLESSQRARADAEAGRDGLTREVEALRNGWDKVRGALAEPGGVTPDKPADLAAAAAHVLEVTRAKLAAAEVAKREAAEEARREAAEMAKRLAEKAAEEEKQREEERANAIEEARAEAAKAVEAAKAAEAKAAEAATKQEQDKRPKLVSFEPGTASPEPSSEANNTRARAGTTAPRPTIVKLSLTESTTHSVDVMAQGSLQGCTRCRFQWYRSDAQTGAYSMIKGCNSPIVFANADDVGCKLRVDAVPVSAEGVIGAPLSAATQKLATPPELEARVKAALEAKEATFSVGIPGVTAEPTAQLTLSTTAVVIQSDGTTLASVPVSPAIDVRLNRGEKERFSIAAGNGVQSRSMLAASGADRDALALTLRAFVAEFGAASQENDAASTPRLSRMASALKASREPRDAAMDKAESAADALPEPVSPKWQAGGEEQGGASGSSDAPTEPSEAAEESAAAEASLKQESEQGGVDAPPAPAGPLPSITDLQVLGSLEVGQSLQACGNPENGMTLCLFQWTRGNVAVSGATMPTYDLTAEDVGSVIAVDCTPTNAEGTMGKVETVLVGGGSRLLPMPAQEQWLRRMMTDGKATLDGINAAGAQGSLVLEPAKVSFRSRRNKALWKAPPKDVRASCSASSRSELTLSGPKGSVTLTLSEDGARDLAILGLKQLAASAAKKR